MRIEIATRGVDLTAVTRSHVERHIYFALSRFTGRVKKVQVTLTDESGPEGGADRSCRIVVRLSGLPTVSVKQASADLLVALNIAADRAGRTVARRIGVVV